MEKNLLTWLKKNLGELDAVVLDIDGVLMRSRKALPGSLDLLHLLRERKISHSLLTNDGCSSVEEKSRALEKAGLDGLPGEICSSGHVLMELVKREGYEGKPFFVMGMLGRPSYADLAELVTIRGVDEINGCAGIIVGEREYGWEPAINAAVNFLIKHPAAPLIVPNPDLYFPLDDQRLRLASGAVAMFIQSLLREYGTEIHPLYLGKPHTPIFECNHRRMEERAGQSISRKRVLMAGDSLTGDIAGAGEFGYRTALLLTGITSHRALESSRIKPDFVFEGI